MQCKPFYCLEKITAHSTHPSSLYQNYNQIIIAYQFTLSRGECSMGCRITGMMRGITTFSTAQLIKSIEYLYSLYRPQVCNDINDNGDNEVVRSNAFQRAASLLAICAGIATTGKVQRQFTFDSWATLADKIYVDIPLDNHDYTSVGAQTWGRACVLAEMIAECPDQFGLVTSCNGPHPLRILKLGTGTGLVGLTVAKLLLHVSHANNFYPAVLDNLQSNIDANFPTPNNTDGDSVIRASRHPLDWSSFSIDIVYEAQHTMGICGCLLSLLACPDGANEPVFHLVIPLWPTHTFKFSTVEELTILSKESIMCEAYGIGRAKRHTDDDIEHVYYQILWT
ncbi:hypothetical protein V8E55_009621 [Tylopilus felleus]